MKNYAGQKAEMELIEELQKAGISYFLEGDEKKSGEVKTRVVGRSCGWEFTRAWYYWVARGPGIPSDEAEKFHYTAYDVDADDNDKILGRVVRVEGEEIKKLKQQLNAEGING